MFTDIAIISSCIEYFWLILSATRLSNLNLNNVIVGLFHFKSIIIQRVHNIVEASSLSYTFVSLNLEHVHRWLGKYKHFAGISQ